MSELYCTYRNHVAIPKKKAKNKKTKKAKHEKQQQQSKQKQQRNIIATVYIMGRDNIRHLL